MQQYAQHEWAAWVALKSLPAFIMGIKTLSLWRVKFVWTSIKKGLQKLRVPSKRKVSWVKAADGRQAHNENSESCTYSRYTLLSTFSVSLKMQFDTRFGVLLQLWSCKSCCIDTFLFVWSLTVKSTDTVPHGYFQIKSPYCTTSQLLCFCEREVLYFTSGKVI